MNYLIAALVAIAAGFLLLLVLDQDRANKLKIFAASDADEEYTSKPLSKRKILVGTVLMSVLCFVSSLGIMEKVSDPIGIAKMQIALLCMTGAAGFDYREHRIPNIFPVVLAVGAIILLALGVILQQTGAVAYITTSVVAAAGCGLILFLAGVLTKQGIGAGDIKLISALALMTGVYCIIGTLFFGVMACSVFAVVALILKKKKTSSTVPFGPFLLLGYIVTIFAINF